MKTKRMTCNLLSLALGLILSSTFMISCNKSAPQTAGIRMENLDTLASPRSDFYQYACGGWMARNPLTPEYARFGSFDKLAEDNRTQLRELIAGIAAMENIRPGSVEQQIADLYKLAMDSSKLNAEGYAPIRNDLAAIKALKRKEELASFIPRLALQGVSAYFILYVGVDPRSSNEYLLQTYQGGIGMGEREYYLDNDDHTRKIREAYRKHVERMFLLTGHTPSEAADMRDAVLRIETQLAEASFDNVQLRNPQANYNKMSLAELKELAPALDWDSYFAAFGIEAPKQLSVGQKNFIAAVSKLMESESLADHQAYLCWKLIDEAASYLSDDIFLQNFDFYGRSLSGREAPQPRWKRAVSTVNAVLGEAVGQMYVKKHFPEAAKTRMITLVKNLQTALGERIEALEWMSDSTKTKALEKLAAFHIKIGYPDKWRDYSSLHIADDSYYANIQRASRFEHEYMFSKLGKPVDKDEWHMTPQTVNAYYNPTTNEICFPAGILQYPFFDMEADDAFNYGAIGVVIGHEMTHGFDNQGRQFDKDGNLSDWWTADDAKRFEERAQVMVAFFDSIEVAPGVHANGKFTLGENIADNGGLQVSFQAFRKATANKPLPTKEGFSPEQRFFLAYANVWAGNIRDEEILSRTKSDPHSLGRWRVNGALPHITAWYEAFGINESDPLFVAAEKRVAIW